MFKYLFSNWKTTVVGLIIAILTALKYSGKIPPEVFELIVGALASAGFVASKDSDATPPLN